MTDEEKARAIIKKIPYITIATISKDGMPWNAPVFTAQTRKNRDKETRTGTIIF